MRKNFPEEELFSSLGAFIEQDHTGEIQKLRASSEMRLETDEEADARVAKSLGKELPLSEHVNDESANLFELELKEAAEKKEKEAELLKSIREKEWYKYDQKKLAKEQQENIPNIPLDLDTLEAEDFEVLKASHIEVNSQTSKPELKNTLNMKGYELFQDFIHEHQMREYLDGFTGLTNTDVREMIKAGMYEQASHAVREKENALAKKDAILATEFGAAVGVVGGMLGQFAGDAVIMGGGLGLGAMLVASGGLYYMYKEWKNTKAHNQRKEKISLRSKLGSLFRRM